MLIITNILLLQSGKCERVLCAAYFIKNLKMFKFQNLSVRIQVLFDMDMKFKQLLLAIIYNKNNKNLKS